MERRVTDDQHERLNLAGHLWKGIGPLGPIHFAPDDSPISVTMGHFVSIVRKLHFDDGFTAGELAELLRLSESDITAVLAPRPYEDENWKFPISLRNFCWVVASSGEAIFFNRMSDGSITIVNDDSGITVPKEALLAWLKYEGLT